MHCIFNVALKFQYFCLQLLGSPEVSYGTIKKKLSIDFNVALSTTHFRTEIQMGKCMASATILRKLINDL